PARPLGTGWLRHPGVVAAAYSAGAGPGRLLGRPALLAGAERAEKPPLPLRHDRPTGRPYRFPGGQRPVPVSVYEPVHRGFPWLGLALSVLRGVRHQRGGPVRPPAAGVDP